jgi:F-type H+-transporting ATPase subunit epsilon
LEAATQSLPLRKKVLKMPLRVEIITQERKLYDDEVDIVNLPGIEGQMGILPEHAPLVTALNFGEVRVRKGDDEEIFAVGGGVVQVAHNHVIILADSAEQADEIDIARAEEARRRAAELVAAGPQLDPGQLAAIEAAIRRADLRLKVAQRRRPRRGMGGSPYEGGQQ